MMKTACLSAFLVLALTACSLPFLPTPVPTATQTPLPTNTPAPTPTVPPSPLPSPTAEVETPAPWPTPVGLGEHEFSCRVLSQGYANGKEFASRETFGMGWMVLNTGLLAWDPITIEFKYLSGTRMHISDRSRLYKFVEPGESTLLVADMVAPRHPGSYWTTWSLFRGDEDFCHVSLRIVVK
jgi:hypothetical protein